MKKNHKSSTKRLILTLIFFPFAVLLGLYFFVFHGALSNESQEWANFGAYFSGICALMAFLGVLISIQTSRRQFDSENRRDIFFQMIELHNTKMLNINFESKYGAAAFKAYTDIANQYYLNSLFAILFRKIKNIQDFNDIDSLGKRLNSNFEFSKRLSEIFVDLGINNITEQLPLSDLLHYPKFINHKIDDIEYLIITIREKYQPTFDEQFLALSTASDLIYNNFGHILGHYFRNLFYSMLVIDSLESSNRQEIDYRKVFRAQISRYEIALNLFNAIGSRSSLKMVELLEHFELFKDIYKKDFIFFENNNSTQSVQSAVSELLNHYKKHGIELTHS